MTEYPIYEALLTNEEDGIQLVSLVARPAIEQDFLAFSAIAEKFAIQDADERIVTGPLMLADTPIYREDPVRGKFYVVFSAATIKSMAQKMLREGRTHSVNTEHKTAVDGCTLVELYIKDSTRGIVPNEYANVPDGSLFGTYKVENEAL